MLNEKTAFYSKLTNETDYGSIYKTGSSKKLYYVPYTEEEKWVKAAQIFFVIPT